MLSAVVYLTLGALLARFEPRRRIKAYILGLALLLAVLVGLSRVYLGVHYPTDVLAGWTAGLVWALGCWLGARVLQLRGAIGGPDS
jgi:undecaprenyl-diphosphatase